MTATTWFAAGFDAAGTVSPETVVTVDLDGFIAVMATAGFAARIEQTPDLEISYVEFTAGDRLIQLRRPSDAEADRLIEAGLVPAACSCGLTPGECPEGQAVAEQIAADATSDDALALFPYLTGVAQVTDRYTVAYALPAAANPYCLLSGGEPVDMGLGGPAYNGIDLYPSVEGAARSAIEHCGALDRATVRDEWKAGVR
jgi:hypothetical protein